MEAWSTAFPKRPAGEGDLFAAPPHERGGRPAARCWLAFDRDGDDIGVALTLADRRHILVDAVTGQSVVGDDDLILLPDWSREAVICLGPAWLLHALPAGFRARGLGHWSRFLRASSVAMFRPQPDLSACIAVDVRPGRPTGWASLEGEMRGRAGGVLGETTAADRSRGDPAARDYLAMAALLDFEVGRQLAEAGRGSEARLERARSHLRRAARNFAAGRQSPWGEVAERYLALLDNELFHTRQMELPDLLPPRREAALTLPRLGVGVHRLALVPLPPLAMAPGAASEPGTVRGRREALCFVPLHRPTLRRLLPGIRSEGLRGQVDIGAPATLPGNRALAPAMRLGKGKSVAVSALLDGELYHLLGIASRGRAAEAVTVFADGNGVLVSPGVRRGRVGHPLTFMATARESGRHSLRFTFLTRDRIVSKIQRTVEVFENEERDGAAAER